MHNKGVSSLRFGLLAGLATLIVWLVIGLLFNPALLRPEGAKAVSSLAAVGERLFHDTTLSDPPGLACANCHDGRLQRQGNNHSPVPAVALGSRPTALGKRNTPTSLYAAFIPPFTFRAEKDEQGKITYTPMGGLFLDGRAATLEEQAKGPLLNELEMNNHDAAALAKRLSTSPSAPAFREEFGDIFAQPDLVLDKIAEAIVAYERTPEFAPFDSRFDKMLQGKALFSEIESQGFELFKNPQKGNCISCHWGDVKSSDPQDWLFTDFTYDILAVPRNQSVPFNDDPKHFDLGLCVQPRITLMAPKEVDINALCGAFRVPTLRNIAVTGPYFHNGIFASLRDAVAFYATRDTEPEKWYGPAGTFNDLPQRYWKNVNRSEAPYDRKKGEAPRLNDKEIDAIVAFLKTLTDPQGD